MRTQRFVAIYAAAALVALLSLLIAPSVFGATTISTSISTGGNLTVTGNTTVSGNMTVSGNTTLGDTAADTITVTGKLAGGSLFFVKEVNAELSIQTSETAATAGASLQIMAATGSTTGAGGATTIQGGTGGATSGTGGALNMYGGTGGTSGGNGGDTTVTGGDGTASAANGGDVYIRGGAKGSAGTNGNVLIGETSTNTITIGYASGTTTITGFTQHSAGTVSLPSISFSGDTDTGAFASAANTLQLVAGGYNPIQIGTSSSTLSNVTINGTTTAGNILAGNGTEGNPTYSFSGDPDTGIYNGGAANFLKFSTGEYTSLAIGSSSSTLTGVTITGSTSVSGAVVIAAGTVSAPSVAFTGDSNTGIYSTGGDNLSVTVGGTARFSASEGTQAVTITGTTTIAGSTTITTGPFTVPAGSVSAPSITFSGDTDTGAFASAANTLQLVAGGYAPLAIGTSTTLVGVTITGSTSITGNLTGGTVATNGSTTLDIAGATTTIALCHGNADTDDEPIVDCSGAPSDIAEYYETTSSVEAGDVVATTQNFITYKGVRIEGEGTVLPGKMQTLSVLAKSSTPYQSNVIGIVSTAPYQLFGEDVKEASKHPMPIALAGRVPVKVTSENGAIRAGDWITASSKPGYAMKASGSGYVIGIALANFDGQSGKILALVKPGYIGASQFQGGESSSIQTTSATAGLEKVEKLTVQKNATIQGRLIVKGNARFDGQISVGKDTAGMVSVKAGQKTARVDFGAPYKKMPVVTVTPLGNPGGYFWVSDVNEKGFTVHVSKAPSSDLGFNWIALGSNQGFGEEEAKAKVKTAAVGTAQ